MTLKPVPVVSAARGGGHEVLGVQPRHPALPRPGLGHTRGHHVRAALGLYVVLKWLCYLRHLLYFLYLIHNQMFKIHF